MMAKSSDLEKGQYARDRYGRTPLMVAAQKGLYRALVQLSGWMNPNETDLEHKTALMYAIEEHQKECLKFLVSKCDVSVSDQQGRTALMYAASIGDRDALNVLLPCSNLRAQDDTGQTAGEIALKCKKMEAVQLIKEFSYAQKECAILERFTGKAKAKVLRTI